MKLFPILLAAALPTAVIAQETTLEKIDENFSEAATDNWIYNDLAKGFAEAEEAKKPLMVVYRCIP